MSTMPIWRFWKPGVGGLDQREDLRGRSALRQLVADQRAIRPVVEQRLRHTRADADLHGGEQLLQSELLETRCATDGDFARRRIHEDDRPRRVRRSGQRDHRGNDERGQAQAMHGADSGGGEARQDPLPTAPGQ
jgi:hypothetical protein